MAQRYQTRHAKKSNASKIVVIILVIVLALAALGAGGMFVYLKFFAQPSIDPPSDNPPTEAVQTIAETVAETAAPQAPAPTTAPADSKVQEILAGMSEREKICQLFITTPEALTGIDVATAAGEQTRASLESYPVGGIIYFEDNLESADQTKEMIRNSQSYSKIPLFIGVDEEGGDVARVAGKLGTTKLNNMYTYRDRGEQTAYDNAKTIATDISGFGFNLDFAPVADVWTNSQNTVIGERAYSSDYSQASSLVGSAVKGFQENGVSATLKHFPGHGDTAEDSHEGLATLNKTLEELRAGELQPFKAGVDAGADMVMVGHLMVPSIDPDKPATLSKKVVRTLLRSELGYNGVVISDSMSMGAITKNYSYDEIVQGVFDADIDMILCPDDLDKYLAAFENARANGKISTRKIDQKVARILTLKLERGLLQ